MSQARQGWTRLVETYFGGPAKLLICEQCAIHHVVSGEAESNEAMHVSYGKGFSVACLSYTTMTGLTFASWWDVANACHNDDPWSDPELYAFVCDGTQIGFLPAKVWNVVCRYVEEAQIPLQLDATTRVMTFSCSCNSFDARTMAINRLAQLLRENGEFPDPLNGS